MKTFVIEKDKWACGMGGQSSAMLRADGTSCCLGFVAGQIGATDEQRQGCMTPASIVNLRHRGGLQIVRPSAEFEQAMKDLGLVEIYDRDSIVSVTELAGNLMVINDAHNYHTKEQRLNLLNDTLERFDANFRFTFGEVTT